MTAIRTCLQTLAALLQAAPGQAQAYASGGDDNVWLDTVARLKHVGLQPSILAEYNRRRCSFFGYHDTCCILANVYLSFRHHWQQSKHVV